MACLKLTYHPELLHLCKETTLEKSDHQNGLPQGEKYAGEKNCIDYYPFGLQYNSYSRENSLINKSKLFQGQEHIDNLGLNWDSFKWRNHQAEIGRFFNIDPLAEKYVYNSTYAFSENKVVAHREIEGLESETIQKPITDVNVRPIWINGNLQHYDVTFTLTTTQYEATSDNNNVITSASFSISTSVHSVSIDQNLGPHNIPEGATKFERNNPFAIKNFEANSAPAKIVTTTTNYGSTKEAFSPVVTTSFKQTGKVTLSVDNTSTLKNAVKANAVGAMTKYAHFIMGSEHKDHHLNRIKAGSIYR